MRPGNRPNHALRRVSIERDYLKHAEGSALIAFGDTKVICAATVTSQVPRFLRDSGKGWVTAEYAMLPRSAQDRVARDAVRRGRALEISRLIGRSLRAAVDLEALRERQVMVDCDVIQADGGTRTASITGGYVALHDALAKLVDEGVLERSPLQGQCAAVSMGVVDGDVLLDLCYEEDFRADVDMNLVMRDDGGIIEIQGAAEGDAFPKEVLDRMIEVGRNGIQELFAIQAEALRGE